MPDYSNGKIYSVRFYDNDKLIYIGSTIQTLAKRFGKHKNLLKCSLYQYIQNNYNGEFKCCYIELLEYYKCNDKNELNKKEGETIRQYIADNNYIVINKNIAGRDNKEYYQDNADKIKEKTKQYYQDNADKIKEYHKQFYQDNADNIKDKSKQYRQDNADKIKKHKKLYYQDNAEKIKEQKKQYRQDNAEKIKERNKQYYLKKKALKEIE
jgi:hypothetical protein